MEHDFAAVRENYARIADAIAAAAAQSGRTADDIAFMAVTKTVAPELVNCAIDCGITLLGENRVQEFQAKREQYLPQAQVHFIGHLQTNKVKYLVGEVALIQSVDRMSLAAEIERQAARRGIVQEILLEVNIGGEASKSGVDPTELPALLEAVAALEHVRVKGLMTIPPPSQDTRFLEAMRELFERAKAQAVPGVSMEILSMGMSNDFAQAIACGSTLVRVGSALFGARTYQ